MRLEVEWARILNIRGELEWFKYVSERVDAFSLVSRSQKELLVAALASVASCSTCCLAVMRSMRVGPRAHLQVQPWSSIHPIAARILTIAPCTAGIVEHLV